MAKYVKGSIKLARSGRVLEQVDPLGLSEFRALKLTLSPRRRTTSGAASADVRDCSDSDGLGPSRSTSALALVAPMRAKIQGLRTHFGTTLARDTTRPTGSTEPPGAAPGGSPWEAPEGQRPNPCGDPSGGGGRLRPHAVRHGWDGCGNARPHTLIRITPQAAANMIGGGWVHVWPMKQAASRRPLPMAGLGPRPHVGARPVAAWWAISKPGGSRNVVACAGIAGAALPVSPAHAASKPGRATSRGEAGTSDQSRTRCAKDAAPDDKSSEHVFLRSPTASHGLR